jgi:hypothetical protein
MNYQLHVSLFEVYSKRHEKTSDLLHPMSYGPKSCSHSSEVYPIYKLCEEWIRSIL